MKSIKMTIYFTILVLAAGMLSCSDSEHKLSPLLKHATVILDLGMPPENPSAYDDTIWNRLRKFFVRDAVAQSAPATFSNILVRVSGPDIGIIEQNFGPLGTISLDVPAGSLRQFEVIAFVSPTDPSAALSFRGTAIANLPEGETVSIPVVMMLNETKIVVPDNAANRIVTIDNMSGAHWNARTTLNSILVSQPTDVSFDARGRIYISINSTNGIIRADNPNGANAIIFGLGSVQTISVDRNNNILYYATTTLLRKNTLNGTNEQALLNLVPGTLTSIFGIDVDPLGRLLIVGNTGAGLGAIVLYDPKLNAGNGGVVSSTSGPPLVGPWDVIVSSPYIYVANLGGGANNQILRYSLDSSNNFVAQGNFGTLGTTTNQGIFYGARRFLAIKNDSFIVASSQGFSGTFANLVSFANISGSNWSTFGTWVYPSPGINQFSLWAFC